MTRRITCTCAGFTLVELIVTITLIGVVLLVSAPTLPPIGGGPGRLATIRALLQRGADASARLDRPVSVVVDAKDGALEVWLGDSLLVERSVDRASLANGGAVVIRFLPDGRADGGPILLASPEGTFLIDVDPWTGRTRVRRR